MSDEYVYPDPAPIAPGEAVRLARGVIERFTKPGLIDRALVLGELATSASRLDRGMFPDGHDRVRTGSSSDSITEQAARVVDETVMGRLDLIQNGRGSEVDGPLHVAIARALAAAGLLTNEAPATGYCALLAGLDPHAEADARYDRATSTVRRGVEKAAFLAGVTWCREHADAITEAPTAERSVCASCGDQPEAHADPSARAYACVYSPATEDEAAEVEWGVLLGEDGSTDLYDTEDETRRAAAMHGGIVVSRTVTPWKRASR